MKKEKNMLKSDAQAARFFDNAEEAWMWFCFCESMPKSSRHDKNSLPWPFETSDIAIVVKRLLQQKILTSKHLKILELYGIKQIPPYEKDGDPKQHCQLWKQALQLILKPLKMKGIVGENGTIFKFCGDMK